MVRKNEYKVMHVPMHTLLEPNNYIASWEGGGEERKEVSNTLRLLR